MAHDFNNLLSGVLGYMEQALAQLEGEAEARALLVDDEETVRSFCELALQQANFVVRAFAESRVAVAEFKTRPSAWDLAVVELSMPGRNDYEVIRELRALQPELPILLMSADEGRYERDETRDAEGKMVRLAKPFTLEEFYGELERLLGAGET